MLIRIFHARADEKGTNFKKCGALCNPKTIFQKAAHTTFFEDMHLILFTLQLSDFLSTFGSGVHCLFFPFPFPLLSNTGHFQGNHGRERERGNPPCSHALPLHCTAVISSTQPPSSASLRGGRQLTTLPPKRRKLGSNWLGRSEGG